MRISLVARFACVVHSVHCTRLLLGRAGLGVWIAEIANHLTCSLVGSEAYASCIKPNVEQTVKATHDIHEAAKFVLDDNPRSPSVVRNGDSKTRSVPCGLHVCSYLLAWRPETD